MDDDDDGTDEMFNTIQPEYDPIFEDSMPQEVKKVLRAPQSLGRDTT